MKSYYSDKLSAENLKRCYDIAPVRVRQYLSAEIEHVRSRIRPGDFLLELGCGYGRVLDELARHDVRLVGIDISLSSLRMAQSYVRACDNVDVCLMNAVNMGFKNPCFDIVLCIQNGISAFHVDRRTLINSAVSVTKPGGHVLFSSYARGFWQERLEWFRIQAAEGLLGEIDEEKTGSGEIVCKDGFRATTVTQEEFLGLADDIENKVDIEVVDNSSVFCEITV